MLKNQLPFGFKSISVLAVRGIVVASVLLAATTERVSAQLNENCTVAVLNRSVMVNPNGSYVVPNVPANFGRVRARATCVNDGKTLSGQSEFFDLQADGAVNLPEIILNQAMPVPSFLTVSSPGLPAMIFNDVGQTTQLNVVATYPSSSTKNVTSPVEGTNYTSSNSAIAGVSADGLVTALASGRVLISALNEGVLGTKQLQVLLSQDSDGDGIPDDVEIANGLNPNDPGDAFLDNDGDGLTNAQEIELGSDLNVADPDTDGDGIPDVEEIVPGTDGFITNPNSADTDGDGVRDKLEIDTGSDPTNAASFNLSLILVSISATPSPVVLTVNSIISQDSEQLAVAGMLTDGAVIDLTDTAIGTNYSSSDLTICNFGAMPGEVFAGDPGMCTVTVSNNGKITTVEVTVIGFSPEALSCLPVPGFTNNVDVNGDVAYIAAGGMGLVVVGVSDRSNPAIIGSLDTPGNANDVKLDGDKCYIADSASGLQIFDCSDPQNPAPLGSVNTPGDARDVIVKGDKAYLADGAAGLQIINVADPANPFIEDTVDTPGIAKGVDVDALRNLAVVADGTQGLQIIDLATLSILASTPTGGDARDIVLAGEFGYIAEYATSFRTVDLTNPATPVVSSAVQQNLGGRLNDVAASGRFAFGADVLFVNGVPILDVEVPSNPLARDILDFSALTDRDGQGIAVDAAFVYLAAVSGSAFIENGTNGTSSLCIGQYLSLEDLLGVPPQVTIVSPLNNSTVVQGSMVRIEAAASDDVAVASVEFLVNGQPEGSDSSFPYERTFTAVSLGQLTLTARAVDLAGNTTTAAAIVINVIPDPLTTVTGIVVDPDDNPFQGATVKIFNTFTDLSQADGSFSIPNVPTAKGKIQVVVEAAVDGDPAFGFSARFDPVGNGITDVGTIHLVVGSGVGIGIVTDDTNNRATVFDATGATEQILGSVQLSGSIVGDCSISQSAGKGFVTNFSNQVWVIDMAANPPVLAGGTNPIQISNPGEDSSLAAGGRFMAVCDGGLSAPVSVIDTETQAEIATLHQGSDCNAVDVCQSGSVITSSTGGTVRRLLMDLGDGTLTNTGESLNTGSLNNVICAPGSGIGIAITRGVGTVTTFTIPGLQVVDTRPLSGFGISGVVNPVGNRLYVRTNGGQIDVFDFDSQTGNLSGAPILNIPVGVTPTYFGLDQLAIHPDGTRLYVPDGNTVKVHDALTGQFLRNFPADPNITNALGICFTQ